MKTEEEEEDQESVGSSQVLPSGTKTGARLPVFHHQHAGSERVLHINSSVCACACKSVCVCVCVKRGHVRAQTACRAPHADEQGHRSAWQRKERSVFMSVCVCALVCTRGRERSVCVFVSKGGRDVRRQ